MVAGPGGTARGWQITSTASPRPAPGPRPAPATPSAPSSSPPPRGGSPCAAPRRPDGPCPHGSLAELRLLPPDSAGFRWHQPAGPAPSRPPTTSATRGAGALGRRPLALSRPPAASPPPVAAGPSFILREGRAPRVRPRTCPRGQPIHPRPRRQPARHRRRVRSPASRCGTATASPPRSTRPTSTTASGRPRRSPGSRAALVMQLGLLLVDPDRRERQTAGPRRGDLRPHRPRRRGRPRD
jgi:hypothetical protein